ncbi:phosphopentomutase [Haloimpatiens lingqiaonensis]|uniref:phosphopentomutase n=1 Tax=Haloimpatiens lingqiaonensis TaxID=1380675 RepID=UPI001485A8BA|nr:phosphopentomutase [Haloimpatiens lingqiaonensis]
MGRFIVLVVDGLGIGAMEDVKANRKEDIGANTLRHVFSEVSSLRIPNLEKLGIMNALDYETDYMKKSFNCTYGKCALNHPGADSFLGHQEIMGRKYFNRNIQVFSEKANEIGALLQTQGYKVEYIRKEKNSKLLCIGEYAIIADSLEGDIGQIYSVTADLNKISYEEVLKIANTIRENSQVPRITVNGAFVPIDKLKLFIEKKQNGVIGINLVKSGVYEDRGYINANLPFYNKDRDQIQYLLKDRDIPVILIGKAGDIIQNPHGKNLIEKDTENILNLTLREIINTKEAFILSNVQGTDMAGHLQDVSKYAIELKKIDDYIGKMISLINKEDILIVTGDHGNDPTIGHSKHTREYVPILIYGHHNLKGFIGKIPTLSYISSMAKEYFLCN